MTSTRVDFLDGALLGSPWLTFSVNNNRLPWHWPPVSVSPLRLCEMREGLILWEGAACGGEGRGASTRGWGRGGAKASAWHLGFSLPGGEGLLFQLCGWSSGGCRPGGLEVGGGRELCLGGVEAQSATLLCHPPLPLLGHFKTPGSRKSRPPGGNGRGRGGPAALRSCRATPRLGRHAAPSAHGARPFHLLPKTCCLEGSL